MTIFGLYAPHQSSILQVSSQTFIPVARLASPQGVARPVPIGAPYHRDKPPCWTGPQNIRRSIAMSATGLAPSVFLIFTPCIAVSLLACWSIRTQFTRRRWLAATARGYQVGSGTLVAELGDQPPMYEVLLGTTWEEIKPNQVPDYDMQEGKKAESRLPMQGYVIEQYSWQTILPIALSNVPHGEGLYELGVLVRMPSKTPYKEIPHNSITDAELDIATVMIKLSATP